MRDTFNKKRTIIYMKYKKMAIKFMLVIFFIISLFFTYEFFTIIYNDFRHEEFFKNFFILFSAILSPLVIAVIISKTSFLQIPIFNYIIYSKKKLIISLVGSFSLTIIILCIVKIGELNTEQLVPLLVACYTFLVILEIILIYNFCKYVYLFNSKEGIKNVIINDMNNGKVETIMKLCTFDKPETFNIMYEFNDESLMELFKFGYSTRNYSMEYCKAYINLAQRNKIIDAKFYDYLADLYINNINNLSKNDIKFVPGNVKLKILRRLDE